LTAHAGAVTFPYFVSTVSTSHDLGIMAAPTRPPPRVHDLQQAYEKTHEKLETLDARLSWVSVEDSKAPLRVTD